MSIQTTDPTPTPDGAVANEGNFASTLNSVLKAAPELGQSPGLSVGIASAGGDAAGNAQAVARGTRAIGDQQAFGQVAQAAGGHNVVTDALNWFGDHLSSTVGKVGSDVLHAGEQAGSEVL